jgi:hypothetical protein
MSGAYALRPSAAAGVCLNGRGGLSAEVKLALCLVPFWLRILQCARRLRDERARLHVVNIGKYATGATVLVIRYLRDIRPPSAGWTTACALISLASAAYSYGWDLVMDWGLLRPSKAHPGLRDVLMVKEPRLYYFAMAFNALLRLTWIASLVRWPHPGARHDLVRPSVLAFIEVFRRCFWNYVRALVMDTAACLLLLTCLRYPFCICSFAWRMSRWPTPASSVPWRRCRCPARPRAAQRRPRRRRRRQ